LFKIFPSLQTRLKALLDAPRLQADRQLHIEALLAEAARVQAERQQHLEAMLVDAPRLQADRQLHIEALLAEAARVQAERQQHLEAMLVEAARLQTDRQLHIEALLAQKFLTPTAMATLNPHFHRNFLPNDDSAVQKNLIATWRLRAPGMLGHSELVESGFRVFSQNDEDGILLRLFTHIGHTNRYVIEIGSNCSGSDVGIPENLSANLIINHGWHGAVFEMDPTECDKMRYFFARDHATRHFHWTQGGDKTYFSPLIIQQAVSPANINEVLIEANNEPEPDLMIIDIDGGDFAVMQSLHAVKPRVLVVEFEKRFRERYSVVQSDRANFSQRWQQSGAASLPAWEKLLGAGGYNLCAVGACGFNAFFVRSDIAAGKLSPLTAAETFDNHPIFSRLGEDFWLTPDETWQEV
jgi:hypothetical protein